MMPRPHILRRVPLAVILAISIPTAAVIAPPGGCVRAAGPAAVLAPRTTVLWSIQSADGQPASRMDDECVVGPDGSIELGPYGSVRVAGLTVEEARAAVEKHLGRYLVQPRVGLRLVSAAPSYSEPGLISVGKVVPMNAPAAPQRKPVIIATSAQVEVAAPAPAPSRAEPPTAAVEPVAEKPAESVPAAEGTTAGGWRPLPPSGAPAAAAPKANTAGNWQPLPRGPVPVPGNSLV